MSALDYDALKQKTLVELGLTPKVHAQALVWDSRHGAVPSENAGADTEGAARVKVGVVLRKTPRRQRAALRVDVAQAADDIGFVVEGIALPSVTGYNDAADAVVALGAALEENAAFQGAGGVVTFSESSTNSIQIELGGLHQVTLGGAVQGAPKVAGWAEANWALWRPWGRLRGTSIWAPLSEIGVQYTTDDAAIVDLGDRASGYDRVAVEVIACDGLVMPFVAPGHRDDLATEIKQTSAKRLTASEATRFSFPLASDAAGYPPQGHLGNPEFKTTAVGAETAPTTTAHGVDVSGWNSVIVTFKADSTTAWTASFYGSLDGGVTWSEAKSDELTGTTNDDVAVLDVAGLNRFATRITAKTGTSLTRTIAFGQRRR